MGRNVEQRAAEMMRLLGAQADAPAEMARLRLVEAEKSEES
jgi:hypothetical protein